MNSSAEGDRRNLGFTLVELLIAITLLALITIILFEALQLSARVWADNGWAEKQPIDDVIARDWIRRSLAQAQPITLHAEDGRSMLGFTGQADALRFVATVPAHLGGAGLSWIDLRIVDTDGVRRLVMDRAFFHPDVGPETSEEPRILFDNIQAARFGYFGSLLPDEPATWHDAWVDMSYLPSLIRLEARFSAEQNEPWPLLVVAPMVDGSRHAEARPIVAAAGAAND